MACSRGKASPDDHTKLRLFADSGGFCQKSDCHRQLFLELEGELIHIAEIAHIIAAMDGGPRANAEVSVEARGCYENLILLCPACHTIIDKAPDKYPDVLVLEWKREHTEKLRALFGVVNCSSRRQLRAVIEPVLTENKAVFQQYGPHLSYSADPESEWANTWKRKVLGVILPNNHRLLAILDANRKLLGSNEKGTLEEFRQHVDDLTARHIHRNFAGRGRTFPMSMTTLAEGEAN